MNHCSTCRENIYPNAKFCHHCGSGVVKNKKSCPTCQVQLSATATYCSGCGHGFMHQNAKSDDYEVVFQLDFDPDTLMDQIRRLYFTFLRKTVFEEQAAAKYSEILDRFYHSDFYKIYTTRANQLGEKALISWELKGKQVLPEIDFMFQDAFEGLTDYFLLHFCRDLLKVRLPEALLKYEKVDYKNTNMWTMIHDFLDFSHESEVFFFDFVTMPEEFLENACKGFLKAGKKEKVYFVCDLSFKGTCKDGFALTDQAIYWKQPFHRAKVVRYNEINTIQKRKSGLNINGHYFTSNPSLDVKLFKLLKKLKKWPIRSFNSRESVGNQ